MEEHGGPKGGSKEEQGVGLGGVGSAVRLRFRKGTFIHNFQTRGKLSKQSFLVNISKDSGSQSAIYEINQNEEKK